MTETNRGSIVNAKTTMRLSALAASMLVISGCANISTERNHPDEAPVVTGPPVTDNITPMQEAFQCMGQRVRETNRPPLKMSVGNVKDYTGKFSELDGGNPITQGGSLMVISALGKLGGAVQQFERFDTQIAEMELGFMDQRRLGDGDVHVVTNNGQQQQVPWKPYYGGSIMETDYYIVGGITELNYNISSGGAEARINGIGPKARTFTVNVAADLRVVDTRSLAVVHTTSLQKQVVGYEVGFELFRFFDDELVDLNAGLKNQEPLQLAVRTTLELGVLELIGTVTNVNHQPCVNFDEPEAPTDREPPPEPDEIEQFVVRFDLGSAELGPEALAVIDQAAAAARNGDNPSLLLEGHTDTTAGQAFNLQLSQQRAEAVQRALVARGVPTDRISLAWYGESALAVATDDEVPEEANRRVVIHIKDEEAAPQAPPREIERTGPIEDADGSLLDGEAQENDGQDVMGGAGQPQSTDEAQGYQTDGQRRAQPGMEEE